ncbi:MAG TPA: phosphoribosyl-ATP diphosphatase [Gemmatimonadaceae bacterium]|jgi:phosphoribosyl-ATP pyrophosphohydrolase/phosphoribosyl-AMP cyclohydrolase|nr:phosphoribosyl-ATP diphosphatase [Gemmatimonadota bacterium]MBK8648108.1 phosphoribosyl-ATP diphosphatase [Gemmatimonadota bacterium]HPV77063.1 phosphoribosyl-ATP diphosphatase [Gemmatimonadaceae bacterium]
MLDLETLDFAKGGGYVTVVCQDAASQAVLMVARADRDALERTLATGEMHYHSRSRGLWHKGATSGNVQRVVSLHADCDADAVLALVVPAGPACHTGAVSCFGALERMGVGGDETARGGPPPKTESGAFDASGPHHSVATPIDSTAHGVFSRLAATIASRQAALPLAEGTKPSYTQRLLADRNLRLKKLGEEAVELAVACTDEDRARAAEEGGDVIYHTLVALAAIGVGVDDVARVLEGRAR